MSESTDPVTVVGLDTATATAVAAAIRADQPDEAIAERAIEPHHGGRPRHAAKLLQAVEECAEAAGGWPRVRRIAVGVGPGAFTGLRVGIATARGLAQALGVEVAPVISLRALAAGLNDAGAELRVAALDARRGELFAAIYDAGGSEVRAPFLAKPGELAESLRRSAKTVVAGGDGAVRFRAELEAAGVRVLPDGDPRHRISARRICALGLVAEAGPPEGIEPIYLRRPDAELWRQRDRDPAPGR